MVEELFFYPYPFILPDFFQEKRRRDKFEVRFKFIQIFHTPNIEKIFLIQVFLNSYSSLISNQRMANIRKYFIQLVQEFQQKELIENKYKIIIKGKYVITNQLTPKNIEEGFVIYEKIQL